MHHRTIPKREQGTADPVRRDRLRLMVDIHRSTGLDADTVFDLRWTDVDTVRAVLELDSEDRQTVLPLDPALGRLLHWRGCWQRLGYQRAGLRWAPGVPVFDDPPLPAA